VSFESDDFIRNYLHSLQLLLQTSPFLKEELQILKFEVLLLYMVGKYPESLSSFRLSDRSDAGDRQAGITL